MLMNMPWGCLWSFPALQHTTAKSGGVTMELSLDRYFTLALPSLFSFFFFFPCASSESDLARLLCLLTIAKTLDLQQFAALSMRQRKAMAWEFSWEIFSATKWKIFFWIWVGTWIFSSLYLSTLFAYSLFSFPFPHAGEVMVHVKHTSAIKHNDRVLSSLLCDFDQISSSCSWKKESRFDKPSRLEWRELPEERFPFTWYMIGLNSKPMHDLNSIMWSSRV